MLECSLGRIEDVVIRKALSGYKFAEFTVPVSTYSDSPTFTLTVENITTEYKVMGSEVYMNPGSKTVVKVSGIQKSQAQWLDFNPFSVDSTEAGDILNGLGIKNGPSVPVTLLNLFMNKGQSAIVLANMSPKTAFVDFDSNTVVYYDDLYKKKPIQIDVAFRRIYGRAPIMGYIGWENMVTGLFPDDTQAVMPFGHFGNIDENTMGNLVNNCNNIAKLFTDMQIFTQSTAIPLGSTVLSSLTYDKKVVVAVEEQWESNDNMIAAYYCV